jgi:streptogrisin A
VRSVVDAKAWSDADKEDARRLSALDRIRTKVNSRPDVYAGISTNGPADVTIHVVKGREANADTGTLRHEAGLEKIAAKVVLAERSTADLKKTSEAIRDNEALAPTLVSYGIDPASNRVTVGVTGLTAELESAVRAQFGEAVSLYVEARPTRTYGRFRDSSPFYGGIRFGNVNNACTHGFSVTNAHGTRYALTAGHCGTLGTTFAAMTASGGTRNRGEGYANFGTMQFRRLAEGDVDAGLIGGVDYGGRMWAHSNLHDDGDSSLPVHGSANSCQGCRVIFNGSFTGLHTGFLNGPGDRCYRFDDGILSCGMQLVTSTSGGAICQGGDSGGPVFAYDGRGGVIAVGIITGGGGAFGSCYYTQIPTILNIWTSRITID